jgi:hypothetical protein
MAMVLAILCLVGAALWAPGMVNGDGASITGFIVLIGCFVINLITAFR